MPPERTGNVSYSTKVSSSEVDAVETERVRQGQRSVSAVVEGALRELLADPAFGTAPLAVPPALGGDLVDVSYRLSPEVVGLMREAKAAYRFTMQQMVRAAIHALEKRAAGDQGPTRTGR
jgi:hypothetical protein